MGESEGRCRSHVSDPASLTNSSTSANTQLADILRSSSKKERLEGYLDAGDFGLSVALPSVESMLTRLTATELTDEEVAAIDAAGASGARKLTVRTFVKRTVVVALLGAAALGICGYLGIDIL